MDIKVLLLHVFKLRYFNVRYLHGNLFDDLFRLSKTLKSIKMSQNLFQNSERLRKVVQLKDVGTGGGSIPLVNFAYISPK